MSTPKTARARRSAQPEALLVFKFLEDSRPPAICVAHKLHEDHKVSVAAFTEKMKPRIWRPFCDGAGTSLGSVMTPFVQSLAKFASKFTVWFQCGLLAQASCEKNGLLLVETSEEIFPERKFTCVSRFLFGVLSCHCGFPSGSCQCFAGSCRALVRNIPSESFRGILLQRKVQRKTKVIALEVIDLSYRIPSGFSCGVVRSSCCDLARFFARFCDISSHRPHLRNEGPSDERRSKP